jgi:hypothetical protein
MLAACRLADLSALAAYYDRAKSAPQAEAGVNLRNRSFLQEFCDTVAPAPATRSADDRERRGANVCQRERAIAGPG